MSGYQLIRDKTGKLRIGGPRGTGQHKRVYDFWPFDGPAVCVCLDCRQAWPEGGSVFDEVCVPHRKTRRNSMARATVVTHETVVTLELSAVEAAVVYGIVGMARVKTGGIVAVAVNNVRQALRDSELKERMTDYGARVAEVAVVGPDTGEIAISNIDILEYV